jgi:MFS family permease
MLLLVAAAMGAYYARYTIGPLQETMRAALNLSDNQIALLQGPALAVPMALAAIPLGFIIDRHSRVRLLLILVAGTLVGSVLTALTPNFAGLVAARGLVGFSSFAVNPVAISLLSDLYVPSQRGRATMMLSIGQVIGSSAAFALGGQLIAVFGAGPNGWRWALIELSAPLLLAVIAAFSMHEPPRSGTVVRNPSIRQALAELWRLRAIIATLGAGIVIVQIAEGAALVWAAPTLSRGFALAQDRVGTIMAAALLISGLVGAIAGGMMADFCQRTGGPRRTITALGGLAVLSALFGPFGIMPSAALASGLLVAFLTVGIMISVAGMALLTVVVPNELRGLCIAALVAGSLLVGFAVAPLTVSLLSTAMGGSEMVGKALAWVTVATSLLGAAAFVSASRSIPRWAAQ